MRKVTEQTVRAFLNRERKSVGNTSCTGEELHLHGNCIAYWRDNGETQYFNISMAGWPTVTTRERLNGLLHLAGTGARIFQKDSAQYISYGDGSLASMPEWKWITFEAKA